MNIGVVDSCVTEDERKRIIVDCIVNGNLSSFIAMMNDGIANSMFVIIYDTIIDNYKLDHLLHMKKIDDTFYHMLRDQVTFRLSYVVATDDNRDKLPWLYSLEKEREK